MERTYLRLDVEEASPSGFFDLTDGHEAGAVEVAGELGVLDEGALGDELLELVLGDEVVVFAMDLAGTRRTRRVCQGRRDTGHAVNGCGTRGEIAAHGRR